MNTAKVRRIEAEIEQLKLRWPGHTPSPVLYQQLEELEDQLEAAMAEDEGDEAAGE